MSGPDEPESNPLANAHLQYGSIVARVFWRNLARLAAMSRAATPRRLHFPNRTPDIWAGWLGHSTVLLNLFGTRVLTDPVLTPTLGIIPRLVERPMLPEDLPALDIVLITHAHLDHLDRRSLKMLPRKATLVVPPGCTDLVEDLGFRTVEIGWDDEATVAGVSIRAFKPRHWGRRPPLGGERGYNAYLLTREGWSVLAGGDSAYTDAYARACRGSRVALALLSVGCYRPDLFRKAHMTPEEALQVFREVGADYMLPIHWGTFMISLEPPDEPAARLSAEANRLGLAERVKLVSPGGDFTYPGS
jgi:L-ascorbate metabolism protein UlaG (beta-lactamase superfamily)